MKKVKDPVLFRKIKTFLTEYLPVIRKRSKNTISSYKAAINIYLSFIQYKTQKQLYEITIKDFTAENIQEFMDWLKVENNNTPPTINLRYSHIKQFCKYLMKYRLIDYTDYVEIEEISKEPDLRKQELIFLSIKEMKIVLEQPNPVYQRNEDCP